MISLFKRHKRSFTFLLLALLLFVVGLILLEFELEFSALSFLAVAFCLLLYVPFSRIWSKNKKGKSPILDPRKEFNILFMILACLCLTAVIQSYPLVPIFTFIFAEAILLLGILAYKNHEINSSKAYDLNSKGQFHFPSWAYWLFFIGNAFMLLAFEDSFKSEDQYGVAILAYGCALFLLLARWFFNQIGNILSLSNERTQTELRHLQSQVNPHFFFNMLNNLYGWVDKDSKKAQEMILKLSDLMRYSIYDGQKEFVPLEEEIAYLKNYIDLHQSRYHKEINVKFHSEVEDTGYQVRPLLFIILVENAFKHGVENLRSDAYVRVNLIAQAQEISCTVENNFDLEHPKSSSGIGLKNLSRRLALAYPNQHQLSVNAQNNIYKAQLSIQLT